MYETDNKIYVIFNRRKVSNFVKKSIDLIQVTFHKYF